ncbi:S8/S53 family peptidase [Amniculibacterium sp. G2-70]|uniref:S8/S53 family peptidase n=1 Tax=Amniculibacterium sp. G2-70 TaxID=2767188 RepID=UPI00165428F1|nr:S8/S53 family peptidase [Amniculibacterium sp. G2-70]
MKKTILLLFATISFEMSAQTELVFVFFKDKPNKAAFYANPLSELTQKSLNRRLALGISLNDQDAPIEPSYIQNIQNLGFTVTDYSKWLNGVAVNATAAEKVVLQSQTFVQSVESFAKNTNPSTKNSTFNKWENTNKASLINFNYGNGLAQIDQINLRNLHLSGYTGNGTTIAVIDTGFPQVDSGTPFSRLWTNNKIKGGYNFISKNTDIYNTNLYAHGTVVLGAIGGYIDGTFVGSAPDADFYLYTTESYNQEIPEEQLYWIEAAEEADRKGVDIITTSLGYNVFDDPRYNLQYSDMNGTTSFIARGAQIATEKGIFVLAAAGNAGQQSWHYIMTPADNAKVFTIGAVDNLGVSSNFSSFGPNSLGIVKPDASARGTATASVNGTGATTSSGTSLATPVAAGGVACLIQAFPNMNRDLMRTKLRETASLFPNYTNQIGYGILNFGLLLNTLSTEEFSVKTPVTVYPNPAHETVNINSNLTPDKVEIYDQLGRLILKNENEKSINIHSLDNGIYYLKIFINQDFTIKKFIKKN